MGPILGRPAFGPHNTAGDDESRGYPFTEPELVTSVHVDGFVVHVAAGVAHFAGWQMIEPLSEGAGERRVIIRFAMSETEARTHRYVLGSSLREGH